MRPATISAGLRTRRQRLARNRQAEPNLRFLSGSVGPTFRSSHPILWVAWRLSLPPPLSSQPRSSDPPFLSLRLPAFSLPISFAALLFSPPLFPSSLRGEP